MGIERHVDLFIFDVSLYEKFLSEYPGRLTDENLEIRRSAGGKCYVFRNIPLREAERFLQEQTGSYFIEENNSFLMGREREIIVITQ